MIREWYRAYQATNTLPDPRCPISNKDDIIDISQGKAQEVFFDQIKYCLRTSNHTINNWQLFFYLVAFISNSPGS